MGIISDLRDFANQNRQNSINMASQTGERGPEFHTGAWAVTYDIGPTSHLLGPVGGNFIGANTQKAFQNIGARSTDTIRHVENDFFIDLPTQLMTIRKANWYLTPAERNARVFFWLFKSPCTQCYELIKSEVTKHLTYGKNPKNQAWLLMAFDEYYTGGSHGWPSAKVAQEAYDKLYVDSGKRVIVRPVQHGD